MKKIVLVTMTLALFTASAHAGLFGSEDSSSAVEKGSARTLNKVMKGVVLQVSEAKIEEATGVKGTGASAGMATGAALGAGPTGRGGLFGAVVGAVAGGIGGAIVAATAGTQTAQDLIIQLEAGDVVNITQAVDEKVGAFAEGDSVLVVYKGESARVLRNKMGVKPVAAAQPAEEKQ